MPLNIKLIKRKKTKEDIFLSKLLAKYAPPLPISPFEVAKLISSTFRCSVQPRGEVLIDLGVCRVLVEISPDILYGKLDNQRCQTAPQ